jgi:Ca-activated chloride channel family protein
VLELLWPLMLLLLPLPWVVWRLIPAARTEDAALRAPFFDAWHELEQGSTRRQLAVNRAAPMFLILAWISLLLAASRPTWVGEPVTLPASARDLLLAVDISGSMQTADMRVGNDTATRVDAVKYVVGEFLQRRQGDRMGLILFGSNAYLQAPLTFDNRTVNRFLQEAQLGFAGRETAIGDAIGLAVKRLRKRPTESRVLILLTDGANTAGSVKPREAARLAGENNVRIYTIGVGADEMVTPGIFGTSFGSRRVNPSADLDEAALADIARQTGGQYFRARDPAELAEIYRLLDALEPVDQDATTWRPRISLFHWPLAIAFLCSTLLALSRLYNHGAFTSNTFRETAP